MELFREKIESENSPYNLTNLLKIGEARRIAIPNPNLSEQVNQEIERINSLTENPPRGSIPHQMKLNGYNGDDILRAGGFYSRIIKPWLASGNDSYKPRIDEIIEFSKKLLSGVDIVFYYAFSKTQSPGRTGSPDCKIDFAEFEMLKHWVYVSSVARKLGFDLRIILVDETPALPFDEYLGLKEEDLKTNQKLFADFLALYGNPPIIYRSLLDSVSSPLGDSFSGLYEGRQKEILETINKDLLNNVINAKTIKILTFLDCLPETTLKKFEMTTEGVKKIISSFKEKDFNPLLAINQELLNYLINLTARFDSLMSLREKARDEVLANGLLEEYPEYSDIRIYGGVTRSLSRWSFLPHPIKFNGKTVNPMHGLAIYNNGGNFCGVCPRKELPGSANIIFYQGIKPLFAII